MSEKTITTTPASPAPTSPKKQPAKAKKPRAKPTHPPNSDMVLAAIKSLKERNGSSLQAIKKYIAGTYKVEVEKQAPFIKKYLKSAVDNGALVRTKGKGASGSFKLPGSKTEAKAKLKVKKPKAKKPAAAKKTKVTAEKKVSVAKKAPTKKSAAKKPAVKKAAVKPAAPKSPKKSIAKKTTKAPASKPKSPKPKKAVKTAAKKK